MNNERPTVPAEVRRRVLVEAGHRCAIPTCRHIDVDIHHIIPWEQCQSHDYENLIALCPNCHRRADRGEIDRKSLHIYKVNLRFAHDKYSQFEMDTLFDLFKLPKNGARPFPGYLGLLLKRLFDSDFVVLYPPKSGLAIGTATGTMYASPGSLLITEKGREFVNSLENISIDDPEYPGRKEP